MAEDIEKIRARMKRVLDDDKDEVPFLSCLFSAREVETLFNEIDRLKNQRPG